LDALLDPQLGRGNPAQRMATYPMARQFDVAIERDSEGYYVASVPQIPACHTQAQSLDEVMLRVREAIELCLEVEGVPGQDLEFIGK